MLGSKCLEQLAVSGIPTQFSLLGFFWLTDFGRLDISFASWILKLFFIHGSLDPNSLGFSPFSSFFFFSLHYGSPTLLFL